MFRKKMLRKRDSVKIFEKVNLIYNIDGHGKSDVKIKIYNSLYTKKESKIANSGFKIFYKSDKKPIMTPKQILGLESIKDRKIKLKPFYINYH